MATLDHLPKKRGALKSTPKISLFLRGTFEISHTTIKYCLAHVFSLFCFSQVWEFLVNSLHVLHKSSLFIIFLI